MKNAASAMALFGKAMMSAGARRVRPPKLGAPIYGSNYIPSPSKCQNKKCGTMLKNKKKYHIEGLVQLDRNSYTPLKRCRRCGHLNISSMDRRLSRG